MGYKGIKSTLLCVSINKDGRERYQKIVLDFQVQFYTQFQEIANLSNACDTIVLLVETY